jgi:hypothetical protein
MSIQISPEIETRLADKARKQGISVEALLDRLIGERGPSASVGDKAPELPVWHLGGVGPLDRRDICDDAR